MAVQLPSGEADGNHDPGGRRRSRGRRRRGAASIRWGLWAILVVGLGAAAGYVAGRWYWQRGSAGQSGSSPAVGPRQWTFTGPAYSPEATVEDYRQEALRTVQQMLADFPRTPHALSVAARLQFSLGATDESKQLWQKAAEIDPDFPDAYYGLGLVAEDEGDFDRAAELFAKVMELAPSERRAPSRFAKALISAGRVDEAIVFLEEYVRSQPPTTDAVVDLGQAYLHRGRLEEAKRTFEALMRAAPEEARAYYGLSRVYTRLGRRDEALEYMRKFRLLATDDQKELLQHARGRIYEDLPQMRGILSQTLIETGQVYHRQSRPEKAEELWQRSAFLEPTNTQCRMELLALYEERGRHQDALVVCQQLCEIQPDSAEHWLNLGLLSARLDRPTEALAALGRARQLRPDDPRIERAYQLAKQPQ
ncbi:MAG TPA: tetratricopeptide repeat protein [Planctomycetaceae bacterium]|nr:tetratricopeptide repeat protein [Planctomycetaceae bacterium]HIQ19895.1 tetratricopeptide repeat protein [Planctomycetota bacterium]